MTLRPATPLSRGMPSIIPDDDLTELETVSFDAAPSEVCVECHDVGPRGKLFTYGLHHEAFCCRACHDAYYGVPS